MPSTPAPSVKLSIPTPFAKRSAGSPPPAVIEEPVEAPEPPAAEEPPPQVESPPRPVLPQRRKTLGIFPIFRAKDEPSPPPPAEPEPPSPPQAPEPPQAAESAQPTEPAPGPEIPEPPPVVPEPPVEEPPAPPVEAELTIPDSAGSEAAESPIETPPGPAPAKAPPESPTTALPTWEIDTGETPQPLPPETESRIQELFLTEERLGLDRVLALCGDLPGIRSCVLARGNTVLASHAVPDALDLVSLTANAKTLLDGVRSSSMRMGLGAIPAVTLHSEKGPVSFFYSGELLLLVLHADRGFVPGVRERLAGVMDALGRGPLPLPVGGDEA